MAVPPAEGAASAPVRILYLEDSAADFRLIERELARGGLAARCQRVDAPEALEAAIGAGGWDLVLSDYSMPGLDFATTLARVRAGLPDVPVILVSGSVGEERAVELMKLGIADFVFKENLARLVPAVERSLRAGEELRRRRAAEDSLRSSEARFHGLVEQSLAGIYIVQDGFVRYANRELAQMFGFAAPEDLIDRVPLADLVAPQDREPVEEQLRLATLGTGRGARFAFVGLRRDGGRVDIEVHGRGLELDGRPAVIGVALDVTERRRTDRARETAMAAAEHFLQLKSEFMSNMSHELKTPLHGVIGMANIGLLAGDLAKAHQAFSRILGAGQKLLGLVEDILDFSNIDSGHFVLARTTIDLPATLDRVVAAASAQARVKGIAFGEERAADLPHHCLADGRRLDQVLGNLLSNAVKFTQQGRVSLASSREGEWLVFRIADTGMGMAGEQMARLFRPFEQGDGSTTRRFGGAGLGLALSQHLVQLMGGGLAVDSVLGQGSTFEVRLPLVEAPAPAAAPAGSGRLAGVSLLVVDDNDVHRLILGDLLESEGARAAWADDAATGAARLEHDGPAAYRMILFDSQMLANGGEPAARRMRQLAPGQPMVGLVPDDLPGEVERCRWVGMAGVLTKPVDREALVEAVLRLSTPAAAAAPPGRPTG